MQLQMLFDRFEDDRALILLSSSIYDTLRPMSEDGVTYINQLSDIVDTSLPALNSVKIIVEENETFLAHLYNIDDPVADYAGKTVYAFWDEDAHSIILNKEFIRTHRMKTTITHELRHALDEIRANSYPGNALRYFTPKKKEHRKNDPYSTVKYRAAPAEINARFVEVLDILSKRIPKWYAKLDPSEIKKQLSIDFKNLLVKFEIADLFPEKTQSVDYRRLIKRAYSFMQKELHHIEASPDNLVKATGNW